MPDPTFESRYEALRSRLDAIGNEINQLANDLQISNRIESANTRQIEILKRHVAKLQHPDIGVKIPTHDTHEDHL